MTEEAKSSDETSDSEPLAAAGSEARWETTTTIKEDLETACKIFKKGITNPPIVVGPLLFERFKKENPSLIKEKP